MTSIVPSEMKAGDVYRLMIGAVVPRPIAFVSTQNAKGEGNLSPFSYFNAVSSSPACLSLCFSRKSNGDKKDSLINIEETGEFVVNTVSTSFADKMVQSAADYPYGIDEMSKVGLTALPSDIVSPPRVAESPIHFECRIYTKIEIGKPGKETTMVIGEIVKMHVSDAALKNGRIDVRAISPLGRLAGADYATIGEILTMPVPQIEGAAGKSVKPE